MTSERSVAQMNQYPPNKRPRPDSPQSVHIPPNAYQNSEPALSSSHAHASAASSFRNVSACNRCRLRKNRCDQNLPSCASCDKAKVRCVGFDPISKREIPRAYVYYLESRVSHLEELLSSRGIAYAPAEDFEVGTSKQNGHSRNNTSPPQVEHQPSGAAKPTSSEQKRKQSEAEKLNKLVSNVGMVSVQGASDPRYLGSTSGISFARVVFAAVRSSISGSTSDRAGIRPGKVYGAAAVNGTSMRDSFFGLQSKPAFKKAPFPDKELGEKLVNLYFENANCQIPTLHRGEFMALFNRAYASDERKRSPRELYMLNIVFAIGAGIIVGGPTPNGSTASQNDMKQEEDDPSKKKLSSRQHQAEEYHASAMVHLEYFLSSTPAVDRPEGFGGSLEELQAVLLLASFALLRPVAPGLWYIVGVAVRLAVDLGLHYEDGTGIDDTMGGTVIPRSQEIAMEAAGVRPSPVDPREKGRREWVRDLRRRLWWCVYSFDRLVSCCVGRPFGITDQVITTEFPSILDDNYITTSGFSAPPGAEHEPSYKRVSHHYFRLRLLQSEILQVLQHRQAKQARQRGRNATNKWMHTSMISPFLQKFESFYAWRADIDKRLWEWKQSCPTQKDIAVSFNVLLLELKYWQAVIMLYRQSLSVPHELGEEPSTGDDVSSPIDVHLEEEHEEEVFMKVATAGQKVLKLYYQLHRAHIVNYTFLATHHLFMAGKFERGLQRIRGLTWTGIAFLYAIWHSVTVRNLLVSLVLRSRAFDLT
ncbi:MAG: hypothetical protein LQ340_006440 [Diploschistes diacapsis]|nr:MAG: hypothetical protein LQ340_006440 [Diploschistes diacapsis]